MCTFIEFWSEVKRFGHWYSMQHFSVMHFTNTFWQKVSHSTVQSHNRKQGEYI